MYGLLCRTSPSPCRTPRLLFRHRLMLAPVLMNRCSWTNSFLSTLFIYNRNIQIGYASNSSKPILWIDAGIHAREWIAHSTALNIIWQLVHDSSYKTLLSQMDIIVVPNTNPDGYEYSRRTNRLWRKTRSKLSVSRYSDQCSGVDANRNYPFHFGEEGVSHWPCQEIYCGPRAMSEPEVMGVATAIMKKKNETKGYIALHSFGQDILYPWGHKAHEYPPDVEDLKTMANGIAAAIRTVYGTKYKVSNSADGLYPASGAADDWAKSIGIKYSFTFELSPTSEPGFVLPEAHIARVSREIMEGRKGTGSSGKVNIDANRLES
uniref:Peptidase_M14 domain-containing protein n=1 Tax=Angiostrongylus cantonensis TaxID=6313 RepID=A0A0K0CYU4_ANGCA